MEMRIEEDGESERSFVMREIGVAPPGNITPRESGQTSVWSFITRTHDEPTQEEKQMTVETPSTQEEERPAGASSHSQQMWDGIPWYRTQRNVRRLQARIVKATQEKRWGKVKALQRLLTHSFSGKALAVRRVTENQGKKTPGVDKVLWDTPEKKAQAIHDLRQGELSPATVETCVYPQEQWRSKATLDPHHEGSSHASSLSVGSATSSRDACRSTFVWVSSRTMYGRCNRLLSYSLLTKERSRMGLRRRYKVVF